MPHYRKRSNQKLYAAHTNMAKASSDCQFCLLTASSDQVVAIHSHFKVINNIFPYDNWDARNVEDHLMITPIKHTETLSSLGNEAAIEFVKVMSSYEAKGYDVYARSPFSTIKSVPHQHTHLIKTGGKKHSLVLHMTKPYISIVR